jgi:hypothetical protein
VVLEVSLEEFLEELTLELGVLVEEKKVTIQMMTE